MPDTGWLNPGTVYNDAEDGTEAWVDAANADTEDAAYASVICTAATSQYLVAGAFGASVPSGATIDLVEFRVVKHREGDLAELDDLAVYILLSGVIGGTAFDNNAAAESWPTSDEVFIYDGIADAFWGEVLDDALVTANNFGVAIQVIGDSGAPSATQAFVDVIQMRITYTEAEPPPPGGNTGAFFGLF